MASFSNVSNTRSMNGIICITDGFATIENGVITTSSIITDDINLNRNGRNLSLFNELDAMGSYDDIICLSGKIYNNYNNLLATQYNIFNTLINNDNNITHHTISQYSQSLLLSLQCLW